MSVAALPKPFIPSVAAAAPITPPSAPTAQSPWQVRRFSVDESHRMIQANVLTEDDAVEMLEGWVVYKMPRNPPHDGTVNKVDVRVRNQLPPGWVDRVQSAIATADSEPEPDVVLARGSAD